MSPSETGDPGEVPRGPAGRVARVLRSPYVRLGVLVTMIAVGVGLVGVADDPSVAGIRAAVERLGPSAPLVYVGVYVLITVLLVPASPFTVAAGVVFGPWLGLTVSLVGATAGATASFLVGRVVGRAAVAELAGPRVQAIDRFLADRGVLPVLLVRLVPLFPFNVLNLVCGVTGLRLRDYVVGTAVGIVPGTAFLAVAGGSIDEPTSPTFIVSVAGFALLVAVTGLLARRWQVRGRVDPGGDGPARSGEADRPAGGDQTAVADRTHGRDRSEHGGDGGV